MASVLLEHDPTVASDRKRPGAKPLTPVEPGDGPCVWAFGGGKGGVGKSIVALNVATRLAELGHEVVLVDADLGGSNQDTLLGCRRPYPTLADFFAGRAGSLADVAIETPVPRLRLVAGDRDTLGAANPQSWHKLKLAKHLRRLDCAHVVVDLGAGVGLHAIDLYLAADAGVVVTMPEPTAIENAFAFVKAVTLRDLERRTGVKRRELGEDSPRTLATVEGVEARAVLARRTRLVVNQAEAADGRRVTNVLADLVARFLGGQVQLAGVVRPDPAVSRSVRQMVPLVALEPHSPAADDLAAIAAGLVAPVASAETQRIGCNETLRVDGATFHVQTEDLGTSRSAIETQVFLPDGRVAFAKRTPYMDPFFVRRGAGAGERVRLHHVTVTRALLEGKIDLRKRRIA